MSKQSFTTGQVLTAAQVNSLQANDFNQTVSVKTANYTLAAADKGTRIEFNTSGSVTCTVNSGLFDAGDTLVIQNRGAGTATITAGTATVNTSASLALAQYSAGTLYFVSDSAAIFFGDAAGISASIVDAKGDLIVGTADNTVGRLAVGTNGYTLVADSVETTGLKWAAPSAGALTKISSTTFSNVATQDIDSVFTSTYNTYLINISTIVAATQGDDLHLQMRYSTNTETTYNGAIDDITYLGVSTITGANSAAQCLLATSTGNNPFGTSATFYIDLTSGGGNSTRAQIYGQSFNSTAANFASFGYDAPTARVYSGFRLKSSSTNISGTVVVYGLEK